MITKIRGQEHLSCEEMLAELGLEEKRVGGSLLQLSEDDDATDGGSNGQKLKHRRLQLEFLFNCESDPG